MKKVVAILGIFIGIFLIISALWFYVKINVEISVEDGIIYDGFGYEYVNNEPYSPYTIYIYLLGLPGIGFIGAGRDCLLKMKREKNNAKNKL